MLISKPVLSLNSSIPNLPFVTSLQSWKNAMEVGMGASDLPKPKPERLLRHNGELKALLGSPWEGDLRSDQGSDQGSGFRRTEDDDDDKNNNNGGRRINHTGQRRRDKNHNEIVVSWLPDLYG